MAVEVKLFRVEEDDPGRCQSTAGNRQCPYRAVDGASFCPLHSGGYSRDKAKKSKEIEQYRLAQYQSRMKELVNDPKIKSLRSEVAILRIVLESIMQKCDDAGQLYLNSTKISDLAVKVERLVKSCQDIEHKSGMLLDKTEVLKMVDTILQIITNYVEDAEILKSISDDILNVFAE